MSELKGIKISKAGTEFRIGMTNSYVTLSDHNCIWHQDNYLYFTDKGWKDHLARKDYLSESIDTLRDV